MIQSTQDGGSLWAPGVDERESVGGCSNVPVDVTGHGTGRTEKNFGGCKTCLDGLPEVFTFSRRVTSFQVL